MASHSVIYCIASELTGRRYVGSAVDFMRRKNTHVSRMNRGVHDNRKIQRHVNKYGIADLSFSILEDVTDLTKLIEREQYYINTLKPYFNLSPTAGSCLGVKQSHESRQRRKLLKNKLGKTASDETKERYRQRMIKEWAEKPELRERAKQRTIGKPSVNKGKKLSSDQIAKITGENSVLCKLSDDVIREIRRSHIPRNREFSCRALAKKYGVAHQYISRIVHNQERKYVA